MPYCSAVICNNRSEKGYRLFRFPSAVKDQQRRAMQINNVRRKDWEPIKYSYLCEVHSEESQLENHRADGRKKLKPYSGPTIFNVQNPPKLIDPPPRKSVYKIMKSAK